MDGYEPHDLLLLAGSSPWSVSVPAGAAGVYPGWVWPGGYLEGLYRYPGWYPPRTHI